MNHDRQLIETGVRLADELREALNDPKRHEWGGPWEHLGDAEKDVRLLLALIYELRDDRDSALRWVEAEGQYRVKAEQTIARLEEAVRVCGRHLCDCCRSDIDWKLQIETHDQAVNAVGWIENFDRPGPVTRRHALTEYDVTGREQG